MEKIFTVRLQVIDPKGGAVFFRDETESVLMLVPGTSKEDASEKAKAMYIQTLQANGHTVSQNGLVDGKYEIQLTAFPS